MTFVAGILTVLLLVNCVLLVLLVLIQLPKKDAGAGIAFGGGTADALFGAGSGNVLTKITKWAAGIFFVLSLVLAGVEQRSVHSSGATSFQNAVAQQQAQMPSAPAPGAPPPTVPATKGGTASLPVIPPTTNGAPATPQPQ